MYTQDFYITENIGNNAFSFLERKNPRLYVPNLQQIESLDEIELLHESKNAITLEEYDFDGNMQTCYGLKNLYKTIWREKPIYIVDNHNHVFYFWYLARSQGIISDDALLYHIDEHADTRDPWEYLLKPDSQDLQKVFEYTNFFLNVGNYIIPAEKEWLIWETIQIRSEGALNRYLSPFGRKSSKGDRGIILNLDLDFFEPELDFIDYDLKKRVILDIAEKADLITICTSPYFIDQERALEVLRDVFA